jgi:hypothetical protein
MVKDYSGLALAPCAIETPHGPVALLGFPLLEGFESQLINDRAAVDRYLRRTNIAEMTGLRFAETVGEVRELVTTRDQAVRKDWRLTEHGYDDDSRVLEEVVRRDITVCAAGTFSAEQRALVPGPGGAVRLIAGSAENAAATLREKAQGTFFTAAAIFLVVNGVIGAAFRFLPVTVRRAGTTVKSGPKRSDVQAFEQAVWDGDLVTMQRMAGNGMPVDARSEEDSTPLFRARDERTAQWLLDRGADVNAVDHNGQTVLMEQAAAGRAPIVKMLVDRGARLDDVEPRWKMTALAQAIHAEHLEVVDLLRKAGAKDDTVTETSGAATGEHDPPVLAAVAYLDAVFAEDRGKVAAMSTETAGFDHIDFKLWKGARSHPAHFLRGFASGDAASVWLRGPNEDRLPVTWRYDLTLANGTWKVRSESWETRFDGQP